MFEKWNPIGTRGEMKVEKNKNIIIIKAWK